MKRLPHPTVSGQTPGVRRHRAVTVTCLLAGVVSVTAASLLAAGAASAGAPSGVDSTSSGSTVNRRCATNAAGTVCILVPVRPSEIYGVGQLIDLTNKADGSGRAIEVTYTPKSGTSTVQLGVVARKSTPKLKKGYVDDGYQQVSAGNTLRYSFDATYYFYQTDCVKGGVVVLGDKGPELFTPEVGHC